MSKHVLVIEDEPNIAQALSFILARDGWDVQVHGSGADALDLIAKSRPDLVILDVMLPGRSGFEILQCLRAGAETAALPVLMLSAKGQEQDREMARRCGASGFLSKPFANAELLARARELVEA